MTYLKRVCFLISLSALIFLNILNNTKSAIAGGIVFLVLIAACLFKIRFFTDKKMLSKPGPVIVATIICSIMGCNFYSVWVNEEILAVLAGMAHLEVEMTVKIIAVVGVIAAIPITSLFVEKLLQSWKDMDEKCGVLTDGKGRVLSHRSACILLFLVYTIGISAILRANVNYIDDVGRVIEGYKDWSSFSRYLSDGLATITYTSNHLTDVSPLMQIIAAAVLAVSGVILLSVVYDRKQFTIWEVIAAVPLGLNPYFLECFSYKFDAPYMAISILAAIVPLVFRKSAYGLYVAVSAVGTLVVCTSYQASSGIFPMIVVVLAFRMWMKKIPFRQIATFIGNSVLGFLSGLLFFYVVMMHPADTYVSTSVPSMSGFIPNYISNLKQYYGNVLSDFTTLWMGIVALLVIAFLLSTITYTQRNKGVTLTLGAVLIVILALLCFGLYPALTAPWFSPRAMYGFGVMLALLCICTVQYQQKDYIKIPALVLSWIFFVFSFTYGNALYYQNEYEDFRRELVIEDLNNMELFTNDTPITVQISGTVGFSPVLQSVSDKYPIIERLVPIMFREEWMWGYREFYQYYGLKNVVQDTTIDLTTYNLPVIEDSMYHTIYGNDQYILIELK